MKPEEKKKYFAFLLWDIARRCGQQIDKAFVQKHSHNFGLCDAAYQDKTIEQLERMCIPQKRRETAGDWISGLYTDPSGLPKWMPDTAADFLAMLYKAENPKRDFWDDLKSLSNNRFDASKGEIK